MNDLYIVMLLIIRYLHVLVKLRILDVIPMNHWTFVSSAIVLHDEVQGKSPYSARPFYFLLYEFHYTYFISCKVHTNI